MVGRPGRRGVHIGLDPSRPHRLRARAARATTLPVRRTTKMRTIQHWIGGTATTGAATRTAPVWNPATGAQQAEVLLAEPGDVQSAVDAAAKAFPSWGDASLSKRTSVLFAFRELVNARIDDLAALVSDEHGKVLSDARGE